jgi:hypothetical protein
MNEQLYDPPDLEAVVGAFLAAGAKFVVVGGFAVIVNRFVRATKDVDLLVPDDPINDSAVLAALRTLNALRHRDDAPLQDEHLLGKSHLRTKTSAGVIDVMRGGLPPLDFDTVRENAIEANLGTGIFHVAGLASIVGFKRLAGRPQDRNDLIGLGEIHGELPVESIPGLDDG